MNLHSISYYNIGPFENQRISIFFREGKYLIKSPIGSGKSFLFFDGPLYALYKYQGRQLLNINSKDGFIKLWFEIHGKHYLITRNLKKGKSKDLCSSKLFSFDLENYTKLIDGFEILEKENKDIQEILSKEVNLEEIIFKNENDLNANLGEFLPPREVFMSTIFLLQDANNIFELTPQERLQILKNVFGLMGIDDAKTIVAEEKRNLQTKIKIKSDTNSFDEKLKKNLNSYLDISATIQNGEFEEIREPSKNILSDRKFLVDKVCIKDFGIEKELELVHQKINEKIKIQKKQRQEKYNEIQNEEKLLQDYIVYQNKKEDDFTKNKHQIDILESKISSINPDILKALREQNKDIKQKQNILENQFSYKEINNFASNNLKSCYENSKTINTLEDLHKTIESIIQLGKISKEKINTLEQKQKNLEQEKNFFDKQISELELIAGTRLWTIFQEKIEQKVNFIDSEIANIKKQISITKEKQQQELETIESVKKDLDSMNKNLESQKIFSCQKINGLCPFITQINKKNLDFLEESKNKKQLELEHKIKILDSQEYGKVVENYEKQLSQKEDEKVQFKNNPEIFLKDFVEDIKIQKLNIEKEFEQKNIQIQFGEIKNSISLENKKISGISEFLKFVKWKEVDDSYLENQKLEQLKKENENKISKLEEEEKMVEKYKSESEQLKQQNSYINNEVTENLEKIGKLQLKLNNLNKNFEPDKIDKLESIELNNQNGLNILKNIDSLVSEYKNIQLEILQLQQDEIIVSNLYKIFSKELLLIALQDNLPTLSEILNNFLAQVVDYQIYLRLNNPQESQLELEIKIIDQLGERETRSLSGGQKVLLKLVWMLAISAYSQSPLLFLDETINNLDNETVGKVTEMLEDFVKKHQIKLYTVTHSQQIQDMKIWDKTISIS